MRSDYPEIFQDDTVVTKYENVVYAPGTYASAVNRRQTLFMRRLVAESFDMPPVQHDFACGTGRGLRMLAGHVTKAHGYDVAPAMLEVARKASIPAELHEIAADGPAPTPAPTAGPALVTIFRLLLNATPTVRDRALDFATAALPTDTAGLLVIENHGPTRSLRHLASWRRQANPWYAELSDGQVADLLDRHGFELVGRHGFALTSQGFYRSAPLRAFAQLVDDTFAARFAAVATDVLYVARRKPAPAP